MKAEASKQCWYLARRVRWRDEGRIDECNAIRYEARQAKHAKQNRKEDWTEKRGRPVGRSTVWRIAVIIYLFIDEWRALGARPDIYSFTAAQCVPEVWTNRESSGSCGKTRFSFFLSLFEISFAADALRDTDTDTAGCCVISPLLSYCRRIISREGSGISLFRNGFAHRSAIVKALVSVSVCERLAQGVRCRPCFTILFYWTWQLLRPPSEQRERATKC